MILQINNDIFIWANDTIGLIYDSVSGKEMEFKNIGQVQTIVSELLNADNLYSTMIPANCNDDCREWLSQIVDLGFGSIYHSPDEIKQVSLMPILKIQETSKHYRWYHEQGRDGHIIDNIHSISIDFGSDYGNDLFAKQILFPSNKKCCVDFERLNFFLKQVIRSSFFSNIHFVGDINPLELCRLKDTIKDVSISFRMVYADYTKHAKYLDANFPTASVQIIIPRIDEYIDLNECYNLDVSFLFLIEDQNSYNAYISWQQTHSNIKHSIILIYNGNNSDFIRQELCILREELFERITTKRQVFISQTLNAVDFGKFHIDALGNVYTCPADAPIGSLKDSPYKLTYWELTEGNSWLYIRDSFDPCKNCVYRYLCPSPSHIERLLDYKGLCWRYINNEDNM